MSVSSTSPISFQANDPSLQCSEKKDEGDKDLPFDRHLQLRNLSEWEGDDDEVDEDLCRHDDDPKGSVIEARSRDTRVPEAPDGYAQEYLWSFS